jgi:hypothetical protein
VVPASASAVTITFDDRLSPATGQAVNSQYSDLGVTFNNPSAFDYGAGFAHSGTVAVEPCVGQELCTSPVRADFTSGQTSVGVWVGFSGGAPLSPVRLTAYDGSSNVVGTDEKTPAVDEVQTHLSVTAGGATIRRLEVGLPPGGFNNGLVVDDVEFTAAGPPPPCGAAGPPVVTLEQPSAFSTFQNNEFPFKGAIDNRGAPITSATIQATTESAGPKTGNLFPALIHPEGGAFNVRMNGFLYAPTPDLHDITVTATNCAGTGTSDERRVFWTPLPPTTRFVQDGVIEVTQAVQTPTNSVPLVAGTAAAMKRTFARAYLHVTGGAPEVRRVSASMTATKADGSPAPGPLRIHSINDPPALGYVSTGPADRSRIDDPLLFELPPEWVSAGQLHLELEHIYIEGVESHFPCDGCENVSPIGLPPVLGPSPVRFHQLPPLRLYLISMPYRPSPNATPVTPSQLAIDSAASTARRMLPAADLRVTQASLPIAESPPKTCVEARGLISTWAQGIAAQDPQARFLGILEQGGIKVHDADGNTIGGCAQGQFGWVYTGNGIEAVHELGHTFGLRHVQGCQLFANSPVDSYPHPLGLIGSEGFGDAAGFDAGDNSLPAVTMRIYDWRQGYTDVMTYCPQKWISDFNYGRILGRICTEDESHCPNHQGLTGHRALARRATARARATAKRRGPALSVVGTVSERGRVSLDSVAVLDRARLSKRPKKGKYALALRDGRGRAIGSYRFEPGEVGEDANLAFATVVPFKGATRRIAILRGKRVVESARVSAHDPRVRVTAPRGGKLRKRVTVRWRSGDPDGGRRTYTVLYRPGGGRSIPLASGLRRRSLRVDVGELPGGRRARFEVVANDGVRTGSDASAPVKVKAKKPRVAIVTPASGANLAADEPVQLVATVRDLQDQRLGPGRIVWRSSIQGKLGGGAALAVPLAAGTHEITVTAKNSAGKRGKAAITVDVTAPPPVFTIEP